MRRFPFYKQMEVKDCGPTCLRIVSKYYGKDMSVSYLRNLVETTRYGSSLSALSNAAEAIGLRTVAVKIDLASLRDQVPLPCIVHWNKNHFAVVYKTTASHIYVSDPAIGLLKYTAEEFIAGWIGNNATDTTREGIVLLLEPGPQFANIKGPAQSRSRNFGFLFKYLGKYRKLLFQVALGLFTASLLQLIFPFLMQSIVDVGINNKDIGFIYLVLLAQLMLFFGRTAIEVVRSWLLLHVSTRINISLVTDFFIKLMNLPISFFDTRLTGDITQRILDHKRIEQLLTNNILVTFFSFFNILVFGAVLAYYNMIIFGIFMAGSILNVIWVVSLLKKRRIIDYKKFSARAEEQGKVFEIINGMQEIKLHNAERQKRWGWEYIQAGLFSVSIKSLSVEQRQTVGSSFIREGTNIIVTVLAATLVIKGELTLGMMLSVQFIIGQLNAPIAELIDFTRAYQDATISFDRISEIHNKEDEEKAGEVRITDIDINQPITVSNLSFRYPGGAEPVIKNISFTIPPRQTTAIVGSSGSGKTTLMKLLLKFYAEYDGDIFVGDEDVRAVAQRTWRASCGAVMQEGFIFNDTVANNIALGEAVVDKEKLKQAVEIANIRDFIEMLPLSYNTKIGVEGLGLSTGQKQRILIARAVYKSPELIFFDEATSALDAKNEKLIMERLYRFLKNRTAVIIAHRLSTVKDAAQIIVLEEGRIVEVGDHHSLVLKQGVYYNLVKNQLQLESLERV